MSWERIPEVAADPTSPVNGDVWYNTTVGKFRKYQNSVIQDFDLTLDKILAPVASVSFADQQALSFRIENRTSDPGSPTVGQIWLRTDL